MAQTSINIRMDEDLKRQFDMLCNDMGMTMTTAMTIFAKKMVRENRIPFEITGSRPNADTLEALAEMDDMIRNGTGQEFHSVAELKDELNS